LYWAKQLIQFLPSRAKFLYAQWLTKKSLMQSNSFSSFPAEQLIQFIQQSNYHIYSSSFFQERHTITSYFQERHTITHLQQHRTRIIQFTNSAEYKLKSANTWSQTEKCRIHSPYSSLLQHTTNWKVQIATHHYYWPLSHFHLHCSIQVYKRNKHYRPTFAPYQDTSITIE
jgi:hypothetical protein